MITTFRILIEAAGIVSFLILAVSIINYRAKREAGAGGE